MISDAQSLLGAYVFFLTLIVFGSLFSLNLALAVISDNYESNHGEEEERQETLKAEREAKREEYERLKEEMTKRALIRGATHGKLSEEEEDKLKKLMATTDDDFLDDEERPLAPMPGMIRSLIFHCVQSWQFQSFIIMCIFANTIALAVPHYRTVCLDADHNQDTDGCINQGAPMDRATAEELEFYNLIFIIIFAAESTLKVGGLSLCVIPQCHSRASGFVLPPTDYWAWRKSIPP